MGVNILAILFKGTLIANFRYAIICFCPMCVPYLLLVAFYINLPFENIIINKYVKKCTLKLQERKDLIKIGITGSYGKTSVKERLIISSSQNAELCYNMFFF